MITKTAHKIPWGYLTVRRGTVDITLRCRRETQQNNKTMQRKMIWYDFNNNTQMADGYLVDNDTTENSESMKQ